MYTDVSLVPWYRRSDVNTAFALVGLLVPPLLWLVCFNLITGEVYYTRRGSAGRVETWSAPNRSVAYLLLGIQLLAIVYLWSTSAWVWVARRPEAEAVVARYFDTMREPMAELPPDLHAPEFWRTTSRSHFLEFIRDVREELGAVATADLTAVSWGTDHELAVARGASSRAWVQLEYDVVYERGRAHETFLVIASGSDGAMRIGGHDFARRR